MAQQKVVAYFKHRRAGSTPTPTSPQPSPWQTTFPHNVFDTSESPTAPSYTAYTPRIESPVSPVVPPITAEPPILPPIPRIASRHEHPRKTWSQANYNLGQYEDYRAGTPPKLQDPTRSNDNEEATKSAFQWQARIEGEEMTRNRVGQTKSDNVWKNTRLPELQTQDQNWRPSWQFHVQHPTAVDSMPQPPSPSHRRSQSDGLQTVTENLDRSSSQGSSFSLLPKTSSYTNLTTEPLASSSKSVQNPIVKTVKQTKSKMNLLNPVSLLMRRRTSQSTESVADTLVVNQVQRNTLDVPAMSLPEDYDPRIRGKGVHDFNAPRPKRNVSATDMQDVAQQSLQQSAGDRRSSVPSAIVEGASTSNLSRNRTPEREHTPVFVEHFDDDMEQTKSDSAVHRESLANPQFLARMSKQLDANTQNPSVIPVQYQVQQQHQQSPEMQQESPKREERHSRTTDTSFRTSSDDYTARSSLSIDTSATSPPLSPPKTRSRASLTVDTQFQASSIPMRLSSNASRASRASKSSRFSFQLHGDRSAAQEKALEEKHKQHAVIKAAQVAAARDSRYDNSDDEDIDYDNMLDGEFEEDIPIVGGGVEDDSYYSTNIHDSDFGTRSISETQISNQAAEIGSSVSKKQIPLNDPARVGLPAHEAKTRPLPTRLDSHASLQSDEMYFDDGMILDPGQADGSAEFDESFFDRVERPKVDGQPSSDLPASRQLDEFAHVPPASGHTDSPLNNHHQIEQPDFVPGSMIDISSRKSPQKGSDNPVDMHVYHDALASATAKAAAEGKFIRHNSVSDSGANGSPSESKQHVDIPYNNGFSSDAIYDPDDNAYVDMIDIEDDSMVAAANADALAADDSGFYGQEFGFYGAKHANPADQLVSGGFFGPPPAITGHNISREPNLTPITERSEFSTRNSFVSLAAFGGPFAPGSLALSSSLPRDGASQSGPGLKEIAASMGMDDEDLTLEQLMRMRREAFGGSTAGSHAGSNGSNHSSPTMSLPAANAFAAFRGPNSSHSMSRSPPVPLPEVHESNDFNDDEIDGYEQEDGFDEEYYEEQLEDEDSGDDNHGYDSDIDVTINTVTRVRLSAGSSINEIISHPASPNSPRSPHSRGSSLLVSPQSPKNILHSPSNNDLDSNSRPTNKLSVTETPHASSQKNAHGVTDSVAYVRDDDAVGGGWFLERRRTLQSGEVIILGRELVEGGRI